MPIAWESPTDRIVMRQPTDAGIATVCKSATGSFVLKVGAHTLGHAQTIVGALDMADRCLSEKIRRGDWMLGGVEMAERRARGRGR